MAFVNVRYVLVTGQDSSAKYVGTMAQVEKSTIVNLPHQYGKCLTIYISGDEDTESVRRFFGIIGVERLSEFGIVFNCWEKEFGHCDVTIGM